MKIAVLSDIHGNIAALDAVLADIAARHAQAPVARIVNLGDLVSGGLFPRRTIERLMPLGLPTVRGNHDRIVGEGDPARMGASDRFAAEALEPAQRDWLAALPKTLQLGELLLVHGTPGSDSDYLLEDVAEGRLVAAADEVLLARVGQVAARVILCGHSHQPRFLRLSDGRYLLNPGSVGDPAYRVGGARPHVSENGAPHARYAVLEGGGEAWSASFHAVAYDWEGAAQAAAAHGRPDQAHALRSGRAAPV